MGDAEHPFSLQSVSKPFVFALVLQEIGPARARDLLGVNGTGLPFNSVMAVELNDERTMNPMVNAGAIATTSLVPGATPQAKWSAVLDGLSRFAGRRLEMDDEVYSSEAATNLRNQGIAHLLESYGRVYCDPDEATDVYTRQCSVRVTAQDLAVMGATLADGGVNPVTGERVVDAAHCKRVLAVLATAGLYERTGDWLYDIGLPGKSGVSGGIVTMAPGKGGLATFSPPLDAAGNSVRGQAVTRYLSDRLGLNLFASAPRPERTDRRTPAGVRLRWRHVGLRCPRVDGRGRDPRRLRAAHSGALGRRLAAVSGGQQPGRRGPAHLGRVDRGVAVGPDQRRVGGGRRRRPATDLGPQPPRGAAPARRGLSPVATPGPARVRRPGAGQVAERSQLGARLPFSVRSCHARNRRSPQGVSVAMRDRVATGALAWLWERSIAVSP